MGTLELNNHEIKSVFGLLGEKENDISFSVAWALSKCPFFLKGFIEKVAHIAVDPSLVKINLQHYEKDGGITDIELESPGKLFIIIEAKRGWILPGERQLGAYKKRRSFSQSNAAIKKFVVLSDYKKPYVGNCGELTYLEKSKAEILSWEEVARIAARSKQGSSHREKHLIDELLIYLREVVYMQKIDSNWVFIVSLGSYLPRGWKISFIDLVEKKKLYFHSVGKRGWPKEPPNYIAFRYYGKLQSIHRIEDWDVVRNMHGRIREIPKGDWGEDYFLYKLGKRFAPGHEVKTGGIYANGRVWCMLDTLFTCKTIKQARDISKTREKAMGA